MSDLLICVLICGFAAGYLLCVCQLTDSLVGCYLLWYKVTKPKEELPEISYFAEMIDHVGLRHPKVAELLECSFCLGFWVAGAVVLLWFFLPQPLSWCFFPLVWPATAGVAVLFRGRIA